MEVDGPNRKVIKEILNKDRRIVAQIVIDSASNVLEKRYGWNSEQLKEFHGYLQEEIKRA